MSTAGTQDPLESIRWAKGWDKARVHGQDIPRLLERIRALPAWSRGELVEIPLDVQPLKETRNRWWRLKVRPFRVFFLTEGGEVVIGEIDRRDDNTYKDLARLDSIVLVRRERGLEFVDVAPALERDARWQGKPGRAASSAGLAVVANPVSDFTADQLIALGAPKGLVPVLRTMAPSINLAVELASRGIEPRAVEMLAATWGDPGHVLSLFEAGRTPTFHDLALGPDEIAERLGVRASSHGLSVLDEATLEAALASSIPDWMMFLHPAQRGIAEADPTGPISLRGGPGTGKTVVALHRARWLSGRKGFGRVLVTSFVKALPHAWRELLDALVPQADRRKRIVTQTVDSLAIGVLREAGLPPTVLQGRERTDLLTRTLDSHSAAAAALGGAAAFEEEIDVVIAGRGLDREGYMAASRTGRRRPLGAGQRAAVWNAYEVYASALATQGALDWPHLRIKALELAQQGHGQRFDAIIVDEAQDLSEVQMRLLLVVDSDPVHRGFMLVGDAGQAIYPGGSRLRGIGLDIRGRSYVLRETWRNTQFISEAAEAVLADAGSEDDSGEGARLGSREGATIDPQRLGEPVTLYVAENQRDAALALQIIVGDLVARGEPGDTAVLAPTGSHVRAALHALGDIPVVPLAEVVGLPPRDRVSVGTFHRAKGLEFKYVVVTDAELNFVKINDARRGGEGMQGEKDDLLIRSLYVAMTRARDDLALIARAPLPPQLLQVSDVIDVREV